MNPGSNQLLTFATGQKPKHGRKPVPQLQRIAQEKEAERVCGPAHQVRYMREALAGCCSLPWSE